MSKKKVFLMALMIMSIVVLGACKTGAPVAEEAPAAEEAPVAEGLAAPQVGASSASKSGNVVSDVEEVYFPATDETIALDPNVPVVEIVPITQGAPLNEAEVAQLQAEFNSALVVAAVSPPFDPNEYIGWVGRNFPQYVDDLRENNYGIGVECAPFELIEGLAWAYTPDFGLNSIIPMDAHGATSYALVEVTPKGFYYRNSCDEVGTGANMPENWTVSENTDTVFGIFQDSPKGGAAPSQKGGGISN